MKWRTKDGRVLSVSEMHEDHIVNAIKWMARDPLYGYKEKDGLSDIEWTKKFSAELLRRRRPVGGQDTRGQTP